MRRFPTPTRVLVLTAILWTSHTATAEDKFVPVPPKGTTPFVVTAAESDVPARFQMKNHTFPFVTEYERNSGPVKIFKVRFPSPMQSAVEQNNTVHGHYFQPAGEGPFPGVVVLHILGGEFPLSQMIANSLARQGIAALFIKMPYYGERRPPRSRRRMISEVPQETVEGMTQATLDIRRAAAWLANRREVDADQLGLTGISLGGIMSGLAGAVEPRFQKVAIYLGGGKLAEFVIWENRNPVAGEAREEWKKRGGSRESLVKIIHPVDPATYAARLKDRKVLIVAAKNDEIIPTKSTLALWEAAGKTPQIVWLNAGHISAAKYLYAEMGRLGRFFQSEPAAKTATSSE